MPPKKIEMKSSWTDTAATLSSALPYLQRYDGATVVIKLGGHAMGSDSAMAEFARLHRLDVALVEGVTGLDDVEAGGNRSHSLRWIYVHLIEEYARHVGHADLVRQAIDGQTGD